MVNERPSALISEDGWQHAQALAQRLAQVSSSYYLECRLGSLDADRLDVLVGVGSRGCGRLNRWLSEQTAELSGLRRVASAWALGSSGPMAGVSALWLEYDRLGPTSAATTPAISACLLPDYDASAGLSRGDDDPDHLQRAVGVLEVLAGDTLNTRVHRRLEHCLSNLPARARIIHASVMLGREAEPKKLYLVMPRDALSGYLERVGFAGPIAQVEQLVERYCPLQRVGDELYVDLTLSSLATPGGNLLGFVFTPQHLLRSSERAPDRGPLLEELVRAGLCSEAQRLALRSWPARSQLRTVGPNGALELLVEQWLDIKLVWSPPGVLAAKAYLGLHVAVADGSSSRPVLGHRASSAMQEQLSPG